MPARCHRLVAASLGVSLVLIAGCTGRPAKVTEEEMARAGKALGPFKEKLMDTLSGALEEGGPVHAISACKLEAPVIAASAGGGDLEIGRTSHKLRNPRNAPEPWMEVFLKEYLSNTDDNEPRATRLADGRVGYVEPIRVKGLCLTCHGGEIDDSVAKEIRDLYPDDQATGFRTGDLRGLFWVKMK